MSSSGAPAVRPGSRAIARAAVQAELSLAAYELVVEKGYGNVTVDDMAAAGGVSAAPSCVISALRTRRSPLR